MMKKSLLIASVIGTLGVTASWTASATTLSDNSSTFCTPGFYAGVQGGRSDTFYNSDDLLSQAAANNGTNPAASVINPPHLLNIFTFFGNDTQTISSASSTALTGASAGLADTDVDDTGIGGRLYAGYQFNPYFAIETGFTQYAKTTFDAVGVDSGQVSTSVNAHNESSEQPFTAITANENVVNNFSGSTYYSGDVTEHAIDLVAKGTLPLSYGFGVYVDAGAAYVTANRYINSTSGATVNNVSDSVTTEILGNSATTTANQTIVTPGGQVSTVYDKTYQAVRPVAGAGIDYTIPTTHIDINVFYNRLFGNMNDDGAGIPDASLWGLGAGYKFA